MITDKFLFIVLEKFLSLPRKRLPFISFIGGILRLTLGNTCVPVGHNFTVTVIIMVRATQCAGKSSNRIDDGM